MKWKLGVLKFPREFIVWLDCVLDDGPGGATGAVPAAGPDAVVAIPLYNIYNKYKLNTSS